ncbi:nickel-dependent hydrogenase large subunit [Denitratisoma sp. agr-D3]
MAARIFHHRSAAMSFDPGAVHLRVQLTAAPCRIAAVAVACRRPAAAQVLQGKPPALVQHLASLLFAVCGKAQGLAAHMALRAAEGEQLPPRQDREVAREAAREHLWHLLGHEQRDLLAQGGRCLAGSAWEADLAAFLHPLLGIAGDTWLAFDTTAQLDAWCDSQDTILARRLRARLQEPAAADVALLPPMDAATSLTRWPRLDAAFCAQPQWQGQAAETGAVARQRDAALVKSLADSPWRQREAARLRELLLLTAPDNTVATAVLPGHASAVPVAPRRGRALVETARGLLMHEVAVTDGTVTDYQLAAPTEWNFHPAGPLPAWLAGWAGDDRAALRQAVAAAVAALDPCVEWSLDIVDAEGPA